MLSWFMQNLSTILISAGLLAAVILILLHMRKNKRKGGSSCGSGCSGCPMSSACQKESGIR